MIQIIDASVAIKWFVENEPNRKRALDLLDDIQNNPTNFAVPELFFDEMLSVLCRLENDFQAIKSYLSALQDLGFIRLGNGRNTLEIAAELAIQYKISGYDAIYLANAKLTDGIWLTADEKAHKKVLALRLSRIL